MRISRLDGETGFYSEPPVLGARFVFYYDDGKVITTSPVQDIEQDGNTTYIDTLNSTYCLEDYMVH
jgi:hypothetical protein